MCSFESLCVVKRNEFQDRGPRGESSLTVAVDFGEETTYDDLRDSDCTSCRVTQDSSAYWYVLCVDIAMLQVG
jgi:hypothetical protein